MRALAPVAAALVAATAVTTHSLGAQGTGVYSAAQAADGAKIYAAQCVSCHGVKLEGVSGPALAGKDFIAKWSGETADDLYYTASTQMPLTAPGSLKPAEYLAVVAYILSKNGYPAGSAALTAAKLKAVKIAQQAH